MKLSICIPTYNRANFLAEALASIESQYVPGYMDIEACISDNGSIDGTGELIRNYTFPIKYKRHPVNQGADYNFLSCVEMATVDYCLILGDDDTLRDRALEDIFIAIKYGDRDIVLFNRMLCKKNMTEIREHKFLNIGSYMWWNHVFDRMNPAAIEHYLNQASSICAAFTYISSIVFKRNRWHEVTDHQS